MAYIKEISKKRFNTLFYRRTALVPFMYEEIKWFEMLEGKLLGSIMKDITDNDYYFGIFGRDGKNVFRCIENGANLETPRIAYKSMLFALGKYLDDGNIRYAQGDETNPPNEILEPKVDLETMHPYFKSLFEEKRYEAARNIIKEIAYAHVEVDKNYIREFQTRGFEARLWELYLYRYFNEELFDMDSSYYAPDYMLNKFGENIAVEATIIDNIDKEKIEQIKNATQEQVINQYFPIRYGSSLYSKVKKKYKNGKRYWDLDHIKGQPFVIAIHDYHLPASLENFGSMTWSSAALYNYLYGMKTVNNNGSIECVKTDKHIWYDKEIPSGFFFQPESENISAVIFGNQATLPKFLRMGKLAGMGSDNISIIINKIHLNKDGNLHKTTEKVNDNNYSENWSDGMIMYHNPRAIHPVNPGLFTNISHVFWDDSNNSSYDFMVDDFIVSTNSAIIEPV